MYVSMACAIATISHNSCQKTETTIQHQPPKHNT